MSKRAHIFPQLPNLMRARLLTIGDELLIGQVVDTNAAWIGRTFDEHGIRLVGKATVGDAPDDIAAGLRAASAEAEVVLLTGGLGPTSDDRTLACLARHLGVRLELHEESWRRIRYIFEEVIRRPMSGDQRKQALLPAGAEALANALGTAPGVYVERGGVVYAATPGVPREMRALVRDAILPRLAARFPARLSRRVTIHTAGLGETQLADAVADVESALPANAAVAYLPSLGTVRLRLSVEGEDAEALDVQVEGLRQNVLARIPPEAVFGFGDTDLVGALHERLLALGLTLGTAESCTGGRVAASVAARPGASRVFRGAVVAYDNAVKTDLLAVAEATLERRGAVSEAVVEQMVRGACAALGCDVAVATSGVAGPGGGTDAKPVGTVWVAAGTPERVVTRLLRLGRDRDSNIERASTAALDLLRRFLLSA